MDDPRFETRYETPTIVCSGASQVQRGSGAKFSYNMLLHA